jgi:hypothetical protein
VDRQVIEYRLPQPRVIGGPPTGLAESSRGSVADRRGDPQVRLAALDL